MTHEERVWHHEMETCEGIHEHAERIASLEELVLDLWHELEVHGYKVKTIMDARYKRRMTELGVSE